MKPGFSLIEVLLATAIASFLMATLFIAYDQINQVTTYVTDYTDIFEKAILIDRQITRDLSGAFVPVQSAPEEGSKKKQDEKQQPSEETEKAKKAPKRIKDPFICTNNQGLVTLSFITANPTRVYWSQKTGKPKPHIARIVYTLQEEKTSTITTYKLYRQEGTDLELAPYLVTNSSIERYLIADNIIAYELTFIATQQEKEKQEVKEFQDWVTKDKNDIRAKLILPEQVIIEIQLTNEAGRKSETFNLAIEIPTEMHIPPDPLKKPTQQKKQKASTLNPEKKELLISGANNIIKNLRALFQT